MSYRLLADLTVVVHCCFVAFVVLGGLLVWRWRGVAWAHVPAAVWGIVIEMRHGVCPLTPLENSLRERAGLAGYSGGFVEHHLLPVLYPAGLTPPRQLWLAGLALLVNVVAYGLAVAKERV